LHQVVGERIVVVDQQNHGLAGNWRRNSRFPKWTC
jgi:hypothetical protein